MIVNPEKFLYSDWAQCHHREWVMPSFNCSSSLETQVLLCNICPYRLLVQFFRSTCQQKVPGFICFAVCETSYVRVLNLRWLHTEHGLRLRFRFTTTSRYVEIHTGCNSRFRKRFFQFLTVSGWVKLVSLFRTTGRLSGPNNSSQVWVNFAR